MNKITNLKRYVSLYDLYKSQLTDSKKQIFELYFFKDFSLQEIGKIKDISRAAVGDSIKSTILFLDKLEKNLKLVKKTTKLSLIAEEVNLTNPSISEIKSILNKK